MAEKNENLKKENKILTIFTKEYKYEGIILLFLSLIALVLGTLVLMGISSEGNSGLVINENVFLIGDYPSAFAWILIVLGAVSLILAVWPFYKPSIAEAKRISWSTKGQLLKNTAIVFAFILSMSIFGTWGIFFKGYLAHQIPHTLFKNHCTTFVFIWYFFPYNS